MERLTAFAVALQRYQLVGIDTMAFIYHFEDHPVYSPLTQCLFAAIDRGDLVAQVSVLVAGEVLVGAKKARDARMLLHYRHVFSSYPNLMLNPVTFQIVERMSDLRSTYVLPAPDAIHLATALVHGAQAFITNDRRLRQVQGEGLDFLVLSDFVEAG